MILPAKMLSKIAVGFMVSQALIDPTHIKPKLDIAQDLQLLLDISNKNCAHMTETAKKAKPDRFIEQYFDDDGNQKERPLDPGLDFVTNAKNNDPKMAPLYDFYQATCLAKPATDAAKQVIREAIVYYNDAMSDLDADVKRVLQLKDERLPQQSIVYDSSNKKIAEVFTPGNRRVSVKFADIPPAIRNAVIAAEDKNFYTHNGVDEDGILRAGAASQGGPQKHRVGGSTITQQVIKNVVGNTLKPKKPIKSMTDEEKEIFQEQGKLREMYLAVLLERSLSPDKKTSKDLIFEIYLNDIYFGTSTYGINLAAQTYFKKEKLKDVTLAEASYLSVVLRCPSGCSPAHPEGYIHRSVDVLANMLKLKMISEEEFKQASLDVENLQFQPFQLQASFSGDKAAEAVKAHFTSENSNFDPATTPTAIHSTINGALQDQVDFIVDEGMDDYEATWGRAKFSGPEKNIAEDVKNLSPDPARPNWLAALKATQLPLFDVKWEPVVVLSNNTVGLRDGRVLSLMPWKNSALPKLSLYDVVYAVILPASKKSAKPYAELRFRPTVQAAALIMENRTGKFRAMKGGFSRAISELNRAVDAERHPGSAIKPAVYLRALQYGLQGDTLLLNQPLSEDEMRALNINWNPSNNEGMYSKTPIITLRQSIELSENQSTLRLWPATSDKDVYGRKDFEKGFANIQETFKALGLTDDPPNDKPIILGALDVSMQDLALMYATIANGGWKPSPQIIESVDVEGKNYPYKTTPLVAIPPEIGDGVSFFQLRTLLQGVPVRGTLFNYKDNLRDLVPAGGSIGDYLAAKTGTSSFYRDAWVVGFTRDFTIAVWVGYDSPKPEKGKKAVDPRTLGEKATAAKVAGPIFEQLVRAVAKFYPQKPFSGPPQELQAYMTPMQNERGVVDYIRTDVATGQPVDARYAVLNEGDLNNPYYQNYGQTAQYQVDPRQLDYDYNYNRDQADYRPRQPYTMNQQQLPQIPNIFQKIFGGQQPFGRQW